MITVIRQSMINSWLRCGEAFRRSYIRGDKMPPGIAARRGSATHKAADLNCQQKIKTHQDLPLDVLQDAARDEFVSLLKNEGVFIPKSLLPEKSRILNEGLNQVVDATAVYRNHIAPKIQPVFSERTIETQIPGIPLPFRGTLDATEDDKGFIHDYKVMKRKNQRWADREIQPSIYYLLYKSITGSWPNGFKYQMVIPNKNMLYEELTTDRNPASIRVLFRYIEVFLRDIKTENFRPADPGHWQCSPEYCGYFGDCKFVC